jgi:hypothetical protein
MSSEMLLTVEIQKIIRRSPHIKPVTIRIEIQKRTLDSTMSAVIRVLRELELIESASWGELFIIKGGVEHLNHLSDRS